MNSGRFHAEARERRLHGARLEEGRDRRRRRAVRGVEGPHALDERADGLKRVGIKLRGC